MNVRSATLQDVDEDVHFARGATRGILNAASNLQQGQDTVVTALQQRMNNQSGVNIDTEMSNLISLQNAYSANARVMSTIQQMMNTLLQAFS